MREKLDAALKANAKAEKDRETRTALVQALIAKNGFDCPKAMIERGIDAMVEGGVERMAQQGIDVRQLGLDLGKLREELRGKAEEEVRGALLLEAVAKQEKIEPNEGEIDKRLEEMAKENEVPLERVRELFKRPERREGLVIRLREEKTIAFLESKAKVEET